MGWQEHNNYSCLTSAAVLEVGMGSQRLKMLLKQVSWWQYSLSRAPSGGFPEFPSVTLLNLLPFLLFMDNSNFWNTVTPQCTLSCWDLKECLGAGSMILITAYLWNLVLNFQWSAVLVMNLDSTNTIKHPAPPRTVTPQAQRWQGVLLEQLTANYGNS